MQQGFPGGSDGKESAHNAGDLGSIPGFGRSPGEGIATHSSILAWEIPWTEEPGIHSEDWEQQDQTMTYGLSSILVAVFKCPLGEGWSRKD